MHKKIFKICHQLFCLNDESDHEKTCQSLVSYLTKYCSSENNLIEIYRLLKRLKYEIQINEDKYLTFRASYEYLTDIINTEIEIIKMKIKEPELRVKIPRLLKWTDTHSALVELIYGTKDLSINQGKGKLEEITACFEFIFQIKLGNISEKFNDISMRKSKKLYIDKVKDNLLNKINQ